MNICLLLVYIIFELSIMLMPFVNLKIDFLKSYFMFVGFLAKYVQKQPLDECIRCGNYAASYIIQQSGVTLNDKPNYQ